jgi:hypothetical protein
LVPAAAVHRGRLAPTKTGNSAVRQELVGAPCGRNRGPRWWRTGTVKMPGSLASPDGGGHRFLARGRQPSLPPARVSSARMTSCSHDLWKDG